MTGYQSDRSSSRTGTQSRLSTQSDWVAGPTGPQSRLGLPYFKIHKFFLAVQSRSTLLSEITIQNNFISKTCIFSFFKIRTYKYSRLKDTAVSDAPVPVMTGHPVRLGPSLTGYPVLLRHPVRLGTSEGLGDQSDWYSVGLDWCIANRRKAIAKNGTVIIMEDRWMIVQ